MSTYTFAEAPKRLPELIERARKGEGVLTAESGAPLAEIRAAVMPAPARRLSEGDIAAMKARLVGKPDPARDAALVTHLRDEEWH